VRRARRNGAGWVRSLGLDRGGRGARRADRAGRGGAPRQRGRGPDPELGAGLERDGRRHAGAGALLLRHARLEPLHQLRRPDVRRLHRGQVRGLRPRAARLRAPGVDDVGAGFRPRLHRSAGLAEQVVRRHPLPVGGPPDRHARAGRLALAVRRRRHPPAQALRRRPDAAGERSVLGPAARGRPRGRPQAPLRRKPRAADGPRQQHQHGDVLQGPGQPLPPRPVRHRRRAAPLRDASGGGDARGALVARPRRRAGQHRQRRREHHQRPRHPRRGAGRRRRRHRLRGRRPRRRRARRRGGHGVRRPRLRHRLGRGAAAARGAGRAGGRQGAVAAERRRSADRGGNRPLLGRPGELPRRPSPRPGLPPLRRRARPCARPDRLRPVGAGVGGRRHQPGNRRRGLRRVGGVRRPLRGAGRRGVRDPALRQRPRPRAGRGGAGPLAGRDGGRRGPRRRAARLLRVGRAQAAHGGRLPERRLGAGPGGGGRAAGLHGRAGPPAGRGRFGELDRRARGWPRAVRTGRPLRWVRGVPGALRRAVQPRLRGAALPHGARPPSRPGRAGGLDPRSRRRRGHPGRDGLRLRRQRRDDGQDHAHGRGRHPARL
ncbi:MAG: Alkaline phosphatase, partial [uncultured Acetobacteraceae bacterium]